MDSYDEFVKKIENAGWKILTEKMEVPGMDLWDHFRILRETSLE